MSEKTKDVGQIISDCLKEHGYDGLFNPDGDCACSFDDGLFPCDQVDTDCVPGYEAPCDCGDHDYHIVADRPELYSGQREREAKEREIRKTTEQAKEKDEGLSSYTFDSIIHKLTLVEVRFLSRMMAQGAMESGLRTRMIHECARKGGDEVINFITLPDRLLRSIHQLEKVISPALSNRTFNILDLLARVRVDAILLSSAFNSNDVNRVFEEVLAERLSSLPSLTSFVEEELG